ncbi:hypothetical protein DAPPUDRAFT_106433 [Daphnia pulex]|uniref:GCM domain-containing protein n=1 Tax=Daphnia pulex TaxID=6669 RepID=E9GTS9_DAPPU|nr:hypothetical protein DAPPUDRAFT_106433 [Daphnia pulex]|eukprot:EFX77155.1 hypothetical protein DAPPUDRAFT_106433 [Daphnia pulex]
MTTVPFSRLCKTKEFLLVKQRTFQKFFAEEKKKMKDFPFPMTFIPECEYRLRLVKKCGIYRQISIKYWRCDGSSCFFCPLKDMYHLREKGDNKCSASIKLWKKLKCMVSLSGEERWKYHKIRLDQVLLETKWRINDNYMFGVLEISNSKKFQHFVPDDWYVNEKAHRCETCGKIVHQFTTNTTKTNDKKSGTCHNCYKKRYPEVNFANFPTMTKCFTGRMMEIPTNTEAFVFPVARESGGKEIPATTFPAIMKMVDSAVEQNIISANFFKMPNTGGNGSAAAYDFTMTEACNKTKEAKYSTFGLYAVMPTLVHRIVYVYEIGIPIYIACNHPSAFLVSSYALMDWFLNLESYNIDLNDIHFMFAGLELTPKGVIPEMTIVSAQLLKDAIIEKMPMIIGASGVCGILAQFKLAFYERKEHGGILRGRANVRDKS